MDVAVQWLFWSLVLKTITLEDVLLGSCVIVCSRYSVKPARGVVFDFGGSDAVQKGVKADYEDNFNRVDHCYR